MLLFVPNIMQYVLFYTFRKIAYTMYYVIVINLVYNVLHNHYKAIIIVLIV